MYRGVDTGGRVLSLQRMGRAEFPPLHGWVALLCELFVILWVRVSYNVILGYVGLLIWDSWLGVAMIRGRVVISGR